MSYKMFSAAQSDPGKNASPDKSKEAPPAAQPDQKPVEVSPAPKS